MVGHKRNVATEVVLSPRVSEQARGFGGNAPCIEVLGGNHGRDTLISGTVGPQPESVHPRDHRGFFRPVDSDLDLRPAVWVQGEGVTDPE